MSSHPFGYFIRSRDKSGEEPEKWRITVPAGLARAVAEIVQGGRSPYRTHQDWVRDAIGRHVEECLTQDMTDSPMMQIALLQMIQESAIGHVRAMEQIFKNFGAMGWEDTPYDEQVLSMARKMYESGTLPLSSIPRHYKLRMGLLADGE